MRALRLLPVLVAMTLVLGAWASASDGVAPTCTAEDEKGQQVIPRRGYLLACGPGSAVVSFKRITYRMKHSKCFDGAGLYFGVSSGAKTSPTNGLYLVLSPHGKAGAVDVVGALDLTSGVHAAILGKAHVKAGLRRGTFSVFGHIGNGVPMAASSPAAGSAASHRAAQRAPQETPGNLGPARGEAARLARVRHAGPQ